VYLADGSNPEKYLGTCANFSFQRGEPSSLGLLQQTSINLGLATWYGVHTHMEVLSPRAVLYCLSCFSSLASTSRQASLTSSIWRTGENKPLIVDGRDRPLPSRLSLTLLCRHYSQTTARPGMESMQSTELSFRDILFSSAPHLTFEPILRPESEASAHQA
jgi:hypothetical protein